MSTLYAFGAEVRSRRLGLHVDDQLAPIQRADYVAKLVRVALVRDQPFNCVAPDVHVVNLDCSEDFWFDGLNSSSKVTLGFGKCR